MILDKSAKFCGRNLGESLKYQCNLLHIAHGNKPFEKLLLTRRLQVHVCCEAR